MGAIPIAMMASRCDASSTNCVPFRLRILMNTSKASLMGMDRSLAKACSSPNALLWEPFLSINWPYSIALNMILTYVLVSKLFSKRLEHL